LFERYPQAVGGDMEGVGLAAAAVRNGVPWIVVKAICDWADGKKHKKHQPLAAAAAVSLVNYVLSQADALHGLCKLNSHGEHPQKQPLQGPEIPEKPVCNRNLKLNISPTWSRNRLYAHIRLFNSGPGAIYIESWWAQWGPKGKQSGHNSIKAVMGKLPVRLEEQSATDLLVEISDEIEPLSGIGVFDGDRQLWLASEEELVIFKHNAITHRLPAADSNKKEETSLEGVKVEVTARANKPAGKGYERFEVTFKNDSNKPVPIVEARLAWTYTPPRKVPTKPGNPSVAEAGGSVTLSALSKTNPLGPGEQVLFVLDEDMSSFLVELTRGDVRDEDISIEFVTAGRMNWKASMDEIPSAVRAVAQSVVERLRQAK
jgi:hypothetical protein